MTSELPSDLMSYLGQGHIGESRHLGQRGQEEKNAWCMGRMKIYSKLVKHKIKGREGLSKRLETWAAATLKEDLQVRWNSFDAVIKVCQAEENCVLVYVVAGIL